MSGRSLLPHSVKIGALHCLLLLFSSVHLPRAFLYIAVCIPSGSHHVVSCYVCH